MKLGSLIVLLTLSLTACLQAGETLTPEQVSERLESDRALLIDVREEPEFAGGVLEGALLLPMSDLRGGREVWGAVLKEAKGKELILYCRSGNRSGQVAKMLSEEGFETTNLGGFATLKASGFATRQPAQP